MSPKDHILLGITMGDPAGIGPEIAAKVLSGGQLPPHSGAFVIGDARVMERATRIVGSPKRVCSLSSPGTMDAGAINVLDMPGFLPEIFPAGGPSAECGRASYEYILKGIELATAGTIDAVVTNPISKEALAMAGIQYPGHTEIFAEETGAKDYAMVFFLENVAVAHVTTHCSLRQAIERITVERVHTAITLLHNALVAMGIESPRIAVGGLNPHAGEHGLFGTEEEQHIVPAVVRAAEQGIRATGPLPPDTVFMRAFKGEFDGVVAMLHDHGFVALKSRDFGKGVNITIGLPIIRTSVGHGTAFDLASTGKADEASLVEAIRVAASLASSRLAS
ncbi:MAG: 4-hydroxythreonine-4-phosphate dehydrogenase PdxA [Chitinivibrionales bacterium]|nr:4-hydroxythreonine-4-phosphate dehydrogenase PdxA [Chitinivibrionales bacterium]MBD3396547.1 4-hydroxythreonine-4-phosphate dehydrogenase PdxA [Chitinivibrionales bacterium]